MRTRSFDQGAVSRPERYVANQVAILSSTVVAERASLLAGEFDGVELTSDDLLGSTSITWDLASDSIVAVVRGLKS